MKTITYIFTLIVIFNSFTACSAPASSKNENKKEIAKPEAIAPKPNLKNCICPQVWMPVCGENEKTYSNACFANCAGVKFTQGSCAKVITD